MARVNCMQCKHYQNTWDKYAPRGCKVYGLKSKQMPSVLVKAESGNDCMSYEQNDHFKNRNKRQGLDLNDPSLW